MAEPITTAAFGTIVVSACKEVGKGIGGFAKKTILTIGDNKYILLVAGTSSGFFLYYYNMLYSWFGFPAILNIAVLGIFALLNVAWVASYGKNAPSESGNSAGSKVNVS